MERVRDIYNKKWGLYQSPNKKGESVNPPHLLYAVMSCGNNFNQSLNLKTFAPIPIGIGANKKIGRFKYN